MLPHATFPLGRELLDLALGRSAEVGFALRGVDGVRTVAVQLEGSAAAALEKHVLPARIDGYEPSQLDAICLTGEIGWAKQGSGVVIYPRENALAWLNGGQPPTAVSDRAQSVLDKLRTNGASFIDDREALEELVEAGLITSDGFYERRSPGRVYTPRGYRVM